MLVSGLDLKNYRYGYVGMDDYFMYPLLQPGSLLLIDESRRKIAAVHDRIQLVGHRWSRESHDARDFLAFLADLDELFDFRDRDLRGHGAERIEVPSQRAAV